MPKLARLELGTEFSINNPFTLSLNYHIANCQARTLYFLYVNSFFLRRAAVNGYFHRLRNKFKEGKMSATKPAQEKAKHFKIKH